MRSATPVLVQWRAHDQERAPYAVATHVGPTAERWHEHICTGHPDVAPYRDAVLACIAAPTIRRPGREPNEWWHYLEDAGPSRWLKVVVAYEGDRGYVRTAFARRSFP